MFPEDEQRNRAGNADSAPDEPAQEDRHHSASEATLSAWRSAVPEHIRNIFLPQHPRDQLLPGEEVQLEIHLAWYRDIFAIIVYSYPIPLLLLTVAASFLAGPNAALFSLRPLQAMQLPFILLIAFVLYALYQHFHYSQWRLIKTNARLIISMPQKDAWYLVDNIEMTSMPKVIDANWSQNQAKRFIQAMTGARDLYISLVGLQFVEGTSVVKDALIIPDVDDEDVQKLKQLVFKAN